MFKYVDLTFLGAYTGNIPTDVPGIATMKEVIKRSCCLLL